MTTTPFRTTPNLGPDLHQVVKADEVYYDRADIASPQLGNVEYGNDGRKYMWVEADATITVAASPGTQLAIDADFTAAAGSEGYYAPHTGFYSGTIVSGDRFWAAQGVPFA
jgi:hypothetical protein